MKVVVLAPHTDDETLACGGAIAKYIERGSDVFIYVFSCGTSNYAEFLGACKAFKAKGSTFKNKSFKTRLLNQSRQEILDCMIEIKKDIEPDVVLLPASSDCHQDHQVIHDEGVRAFKHSTILGYECPWNSFNFSNTAYVRLSPDHITTKVIAMQEYTSQFDRPYFKEETIISLARVRGLQAGCEYAECYEVIRQFL